MNIKGLFIVVLISTATWAAETQQSTPIGAPVKIAAPSPALEKALQNPSALFVTYKSREMAEEKDAKAGADTFKQALEKANYEVVQVKIVKEPTIAEDLFQYSFIIMYRAKDGFQFKPIQKYYRDGFSSLDAAKKTYTAWRGEQAKNGAVLLVVDLQPMSPPPSIYEIMVDYAYPLRMKSK